MNICWNRAHPDQALLILSSEEACKRNPEYFTGETLDIDADTGGYNLQLAFSTGFLCGTSIAGKLRKTGSVQSVSIQGYVSPDKARER